MFRGLGFRRLDVGAQGPSPYSRRSLLQARESPLVMPMGPLRQKLFTLGTAPTQ